MKTTVRNRREPGWQGAPGPVHRRLAAAIVVVMGLASCANETGGTELDREQVQTQLATWVNQTGLVDTRIDLWVERMERACTDGVWDHEVARALAQEFVGDVDAAADPATVAAGAQALWIMGAQLCRDSYPAGAIDAGPPPA